MARNDISHRLQVWIDARKRHRLSHAQVQRARELGMNPKRLGNIATCLHRMMVERCAPSRKFALDCSVTL
jgi:hypothetical protein